MTIEYFLINRLYRSAKKILIGPSLNSTATPLDQTERETNKYYFALSV